MEMSSKLMLLAYVTILTHSFLLYPFNVLCRKLSLDIVFFVRFYTAVVVDRKINMKFHEISGHYVTMFVFVML